VVKIHWTSAPNVSQDERDANAKVIETLALPKHRGGGRLAIIGGGPSIHSHLEELKAWDGAIWAVNGAINWCIDNDIKAYFYTADASRKANWVYDLSRVRLAVLAPDVSPELVAYLQENGADISLTAPIQSGPTSVNASDYLALQCGYRDMTYFGCEGSFAEPEMDANTHAFASFPIPDWIIVEVGGEYFKTKPEFVSQSIMLANIIKAFPRLFSEKSGGLLRAMIQHGPAYDVVMVSNTMYAKLTDKEAA
jgi:hypothetical protein